MGALVIRDLVAADWPAVAVLADVAVAAVPGAPPQAEWVANRQRAPEPRHQVVAERDGAVVGFASIERRQEDPTGAWRAFLVLDWSTPDEVAPALHAANEAALVDVGAASAWLREYADDDALVGFATARGFVASPPYEVGGSQVVTLTRDLDPDAAA